MQAESQTTRDKTTPSLWIGSLIIVGIALCRAMTAHGRLAWWDLDATRVILPETTITPAWSLTLDALVWAAVAIIGMALYRRGRRIALPMWGLMLVAIGTVAYHGIFKPLPGGELPAEMATLIDRINAPISEALGTPVDPAERVRGSFESMVRGSLWLAAMAGGLALMLAARADPALRRVAAAALLSLACVLVMKGAHQFIIEHPQTVADFEASTEATLAAQGLQPGTPTAREFERRLRHPDATGWFGLSNVYGSIMAAVLVAAIGVLSRVWAGRRIAERTTSELLAGVAFLAVAATGLWFAQSTGATGAFLVALIATAWLAWSPGLARGRLGERLPRILPPPTRVWLMPTRRHFGLVMIALIAASFFAIIARGIIGEAIGELSLLFRWHYLTASVRIWLEHPLLGIGPGEFQNAYALAKPAINPELIESPHSVIIDWIATLGIGGLAMAIVLCWLAWRIGLSAGRQPIEAGANTHAAHRRDRIALLLTIAAAAGVSGMRQLPTTGGGEAIARMLGIVAMLVAALLIARWLRVGIGQRAIARRAWIAVAGAAAALLAHGQIEMVFTTPGSAGWVMALLAIAAAGTPAQSPATQPPARNIALPIGAAFVAATLALLAWNATRWEHELARAAAAARPLAEVRSALAALPTAGGRAEFNRLLGTIVDQVVPAGQAIDQTTMQQLETFIANYERATNRVVARRLLSAYLAEPSVPGPLRRAAGLWLASGDLTGARAATALLLTRFPDHSSSVASAALILETILQSTAQPPDAELAAAAWTRAHRLDPMAVRPPLRLVEIELAFPGTVRSIPDPIPGGALHTDNKPAAAVWAERALWNDEMLRLDPLKQMPDPERRRLRDLAARP